MRRRSFLLLSLVAIAALTAACGSDPAATAEDVAVPTADVHDAAEPDAALAEDAGTGDLVAPDAAPDVAGVDVPPPPLAATRVRYDFAARPQVLPFPYDRYLVDDPTSSTGQRVLLDRDGRSNSIVDGVFGVLSTYVPATNDGRGFGPFAWLSVELAGAAPIAFTLDGGNTPAPTSGVRLFTWDGATVTGELALRARVATAADPDGTLHQYLDLLPWRPLPDGARVLVAVTDALLDADGQPVGADEHFQVVAGLRAPPDDAALADALAAEGTRLAPALVALEAAGLPRSTLAVAFDVTVADARTELLALGAALAAEPGPPPVAYTLDPDGDGVDNVFRPGDPGFPGVPDGTVGLVARGTFQRRNYRHGTVTTGTFRPGDDGLPVAVGDEPLAFWLALPADPPVGPWPAVVLLHGINSHKDEVWPMGASLAGAGFAVLAYDLPRHGEDGKGALDFLNLTAPLAARDNFRQGAADFVLARRLLATFADEGLDLAPPGGDGVGDIRPGRIGLVGNSLGAMIGLMGSSLTDEPGAAVLAVGGGGIMFFFRFFLEQQGLLVLVPAPVVHGIEVLAGHIVGPGDPIAYAEAFRPAPPAYRDTPHDALLLEVLGDETMPEDTLESTAIALDVPQIAPVPQPVPGMAVADDGTSGLVQVTGARHNILFGAAEPGVTEAARGLIAEYLRAYLEDGTPRIVNPFTAP